MNDLTRMPLSGVVVGHDGVVPEAIRLGRRVDPDTGEVAEKLPYEGDLNLLVIGPNGSGKGTRLLTPTLLQMHGARSVVVVDPKGEQAALTAPFRRQLGRVVILNPFGVLTDTHGFEDLTSEGHNPLLALDHRSSEFNSDAALLAEAMVPLGGKDPYWELSARSLIAAIIMWVVLEARGVVEPFIIDSERHVRRTQPTIARVRELLCQPSGGSTGDNGRLGVSAYGLPALAQQMTKTDFEGLRNKAGQFTSWERDVQSVARTAMQHTECFDDTSMAADLSRGTFDFRELKSRPTTVYLILPPKHFERHAKWLRLVVTSAMQASLRERRAGEPRVLFILDEFFALGHLQIIATNWALARGYGVQIMPVLQDINQLKTLYPKQWETFAGNAGVVACFGPNDVTTAEWISRRCGERTREFKTVSSSRTLTNGNTTGTSTSSSWNGNSPGSSSGNSEGISNSVSTNTSSNSNIVKVPLITPHELLGIGEGHLVLMFAGTSDVTAAYAPGYYQITACRSRVTRDNPYRLG